MLSLFSGAAVSGFAPGAGVPIAQQPMRAHTRMLIEPVVLDQLHLPSTMLADQSFSLPSMVNLAAEEIRKTMKSELDEVLEDVFGLAPFFITAPAFGYLVYDRKRPAERQQKKMPNPVLYPCVGPPDVTSCCLDLPLVMHLLRDTMQILCPCVGIDSDSSSCLVLYFVMQSSPRPGNARSK